MFLMSKPISSLFNILLAPALAAVLLSSANALANESGNDLCDSHNEWGIRQAMKTLDQLNKDAGTDYKIEKIAANNYRLIITETWPENIYANVEAYSSHTKQILGTLGNDQANGRTNCLLLGAINANNRVLEAIANYMKYVEFSIRPKITYPDGSRERII